MTISHLHDEFDSDGAGIALAALGWVLQDGDRAQRFLDLTGLTPDQLRTRIADPALHQAVLEYLSGHEQDLLNAAEALQLPVERLATALKGRPR